MADKCFDSTASDLLCTEAESTCFDDDDDDLEAVAEVVDEEIHQENDKDLSFGNDRSELLIPLPCLSEEKFLLMVDKERGHLPKDDYLERLRAGDMDMSVRKEALDWILKAQAHYGFGEVTTCLSMHYFDRFMSLYELPRDRTWAIQLLAVACLSLAAKMEEIKVPLTVDLQVGEPKFLFEGKTIQRMELLVLSTLEWKMRAYTPYTFIDYFLRKMIDDDQQAFESLIERAIKLILTTTKGIDFLAFKPSEIAAAVATFVASEKHASDVDKAMSGFISSVEKNKVVKCLELIQDLTVISEGSTNAGGATTTNVGGAMVASLPHSPNGVLEAVACLSYKSDERTTTKATVGSCPTNSSHTSPETKRKKLDTRTFQKS